MTSVRSGIVRNRRTISVSIIVLLVAISSYIYRNKILGYAMYEYHRITTPSHIEFHGLRINEIPSWWVHSINESSRVVVARIPNNRKDKIITLSIYENKINYDDLCNKIAIDGWAGSACNLRSNKPLEYLRSNSDGDAKHYDVFWFFPSANVGVLGIRYKKEEIRLAKQFVYSLDALKRDK